MGRPRKHSPEVKAALVLEYRAYKLNGGVPPGWVTRKAVELGMNEGTIYAYINAYEEPPPVPGRVVPKRLHFDHSAAMRGGGTLSVHASKWE